MLAQCLLVKNKKNILALYDDKAKINRLVARDKKDVCCKK
ncbi:MAG: hypothetical protein ACD_7C00153G0003 [uncultured bacterium]|nr:MAG: hypothetical protein ACD_7C00153G0003 [uncultured bacterium]